MRGIINKDIFIKWKYYKIFVQKVNETNGKLTKESPILYQEISELFLLSRILPL